MGLKKVVSFVLVMAVCAFSVVPVKATALLHLDVEQSEAYLPKVITYVNIMDETGSIVKGLDVTAEDTEVTMNGEKLHILSVQKQQETDHGVHYFYLLDVSTSISQYALDKVKNAIMEQVRNKSDEDHVSVITFGTSVNVVLDGDESVDEAIQKLEPIAATQDKTVLHDAIMKVIEIVESSAQYSGNRSVMAVVSDGMDEQTGGITQKEILDKVTRVNIPIFAFGYQGARTGPLESLGELSRCSGGYMELITAETAAMKIHEFQNRIGNTIRIESETSNNTVNADTADISVNITVDGTVYSSTAIVSYRNHIKDTTAPKIENVRVVDRNRLEVLFSEDVTGLEKTGMLFLANTRGKTFTVLSAVYDNNAKTAVITTDETLYADSYVLTMMGVTDTSIEKNHLVNGTYTFETTENSRRGIYLAVGLGVLLLAAAVIVAVILKKKMPENTREQSQASRGNRVCLEQSPGIEVEFAIVESNRAQRKVNTMVSGLYIVGREASMCELAISDRRLSRQHFALLYDNEALKLQDLGSTNGTQVNGIPVQHERVIVNGDVIEAGNTKIMINIK